MKYLMISILCALATYSQVNAQESQPITDPEQEQDTVQQQVSDQEQVSEDELRKYAVAMDSINDMKESLLKEISDIIKADGKMTNARYNELSKIADDEAKLAQAKATEAEKALLKKVADKKTEGTEKINTTFQALAKDYVGVESYNKVKKALESDAELQAKYETVLKEVDQEGL